MEAPLAFITLFLGLTSGPQLVELSTTAPVAAIEIRLDGVVQSRLDAPPWRATVDLGRALEPRQMTATAYDLWKREIGSVSQLINVPRPPAEIHLLVDRDTKGRPTRVRWLGATVIGDSSAPRAEITLDGKRLPVAADGTALLPLLDLDLPHVVSAVVHFSAEVSARRDLVLGAPVNDELRGELSSTIYRPRRATGKGEPPLPSARARDLPLHVVATERGEALVLVVRPPKLGSDKLGRLLQTTRPRHNRPARRTDARLADGDRTRVLWPLPANVPGATRGTRLYDSTADFPADRRGFYWLLAWISHRNPEGAPHWAEAVAVAGAQAYASGDRRAVVLILDGSARDPSQYSPEQVRRYLEHLRVPLFVWSLGDSTLARAWGESRDLLEPDGVERATEELRNDLEAQRVVWVEGQEIPDRIEVVEATTLSKGSGT